MESILNANTSEINTIKASISSIKIDRNKDIVNILSSIKTIVNHSSLFQDIKIIRNKDEDLLKQVGKQFNQKEDAIKRNLPNGSEEELFKHIKADFKKEFEEVIMLIFWQLAIDSSYYNRLKQSIKMIFKR